MKCTICKEKAVIHIRHHNLSLCQTHFINRFEKITLETIRKYKMFSKKELLLVAISGGKDSLSVFHVLNKYKFRCIGVYLDLGISKGFPYSELSKQKVLEYQKKLGGEVRVVEVKEELGFSVPEAAEKRHTLDKVCRVCGIIKRYYLNKIGYELGATTVVTGHNLDDEVATLFGNTLRWDTNYLFRQAPLLPSTHPKLLKRAKPFVFFTEKETALYAILNQIQYIRDECPFSIGAKTLLYKDILNKLEEISPGTKYRFYKEFLNFISNIKTHLQEPKLNECKFCEMPTSLEVCSVCSLKGLKNKIAL